MSCHLHSNSQSCSAVARTRLPRHQLVAALVLLEVDSVVAILASKTIVRRRATSAVDQTTSLATARPRL